MDLPQQFRDKHLISALVQAFDKELVELESIIKSLSTDRWLASAAGKQLDMIGSIVNLSRADVISMLAVEPVDEIYKILLKYKIIANTNRCTISELFDACRLLYNAQVITYRESRSSPASFSLSVGTDLNPQTLALLNSKGISIKPAGVRCSMSYYTMDFFGFKDLNEHARGFGEGRFAQDIT